MSAAGPGRARPAESRTGPRVVLGVSGGIAAYKACELLRLLTESGHDVTVVPTAAALNFVGAPTWAALSGKPVHSDLWADAHEVPHVRLGQQADLVLVVPATADLLARAAHGLADDLLANVLLTARCPVVFAPAMHTEMWLHAATQANVALLRERGAVVIDPAVGRLTGADSGPGRLPEPAEIAEVARRVLARGLAGLRPDLTGRRVVVSAGGTREALDPVRFLGNRSSGRQGYALATTAIARGAEVTVVAANVTLPDPAGAKLVRVVSADDLRAAVVEAARDADAVVMAAAVADFRPATTSGSKIKKADADPPPLQLTRNPEVLAELGRLRPPGQVLVGFAAETDDVLANGRAKLVAKGADLLVVNEVGAGKGFDLPDNAATILGADGSTVEVGPGPKLALADVVWDLVRDRLGEPR
ncbi:MAG: phosphopantothenoylcysteine decarboxylase / phosphopantothenate---cysteine ligase [Actinomycetota bacterium]|nr:phosphopantothenoylcysteine decarboxylase / phosphopantothenate---cysteine ligase [Actinomycetota bacterium]